MKTKVKSVNLLFVGKDPENLESFIEVFKESTLPNNIRFAGNQNEALKMIFQKGEYKHTPIPDIIITDIDSYRKEVRSGILDVIAQREDIKCIPTVILIYLEEEKDEIKIKNCPNLLIRKPDNLEGYQNAVKSVEEYWLNLHKK
jgi:CheY-like chemotaxis protein